MVNFDGPWWVAAILGGLAVLVVEMPAVMRWLEAKRICSRAGCLTLMLVLTAAIGVQMVIGSKHGELILEWCAVVGCGAFLAALGVAMVRESRRKGASWQAVCGWLSFAVFVLLWLGVVMSGHFGSVLRFLGVDGW